MSWKEISTDTFLTEADLYYLYGLKADLYGMFLLKKIGVYSVVWVETSKLYWNQGLAISCGLDHMAEPFALYGIVWRWSTVTGVLAGAYFPYGLGGKLLAASGLQGPLWGQTHQSAMRDPSGVTWKQTLHWQLVCVQMPHYQTVKPHGTGISIHRPACRDQVDYGYKRCPKKELNKGDGDIPSFLHMYCCFFMPHIINCNSTLRERYG